MKKRYLFLMCISSYAWPILEHDRAAYAAQKDKWQDATAFMAKAVSKHYNNPNVLYDAGVAAFKAGDYEQAQAYFNDVAQSGDSKYSELQERALYNAGNTYAERQQILERAQDNSEENEQQQKTLLENAIASYEQALKLSPQDKRAWHNLEVVKKRLQKKQQQEEQDKQDQNQKDDQKEDGKQDKSGDGKQDKKSRKDRKKDKQKNKKGDDKQDQPGNDQKGDGKQDQQGGNKQQDNQGTQNNGKDKQHNKQPEQQKGNDGHKKEQEKSGNDGKQPKDQSSKEAPGQSLNMAQNNDKNTQHDGRDGVVARILHEQEMRDVQLNKNMIKAAVGKQLAGNDGQNCW